MILPNNYSQNSKKNVFNDLIPKKRQNMDFDNKYIKTIYDISNKKDNDIEEDIRKKKKPQKRGNIWFILFYLLKKKNI